MNRDPVRIPQELRQKIVTEFAEKLSSDGNDVIIVSMDSNHLHALARFDDHEARHWIGRCKKHVSHVLRQEDLRRDEGGIWGKRSRAEPIRDRAHQVNTFKYILRHAVKGAAIWRFAPQS
jgi:hypothetical protein